MYCHSWLLDMYSKQEATVSQSSSTLGVEQVSSLIAMYVYTLHIHIPLQQEHTNMSKIERCMAYHSGVTDYLWEHASHASQDAWTRKGSQICTHTYTHICTHAHTRTGHMNVHFCKLLNVTWKNLQLFQFLNFCLQIRSHFFQHLNLLLELWLPGPWQWPLLSSCVLCAQEMCLKEIHTIKVPKVNVYLCT